MDPLRQGSRTTASLPMHPNSSSQLFQFNASLSSSSSHFPNLLGNVHQPFNHPGITNPNATDANDGLFQLEAVQEPYIKFVFVWFGLTSIISLLLNIVALILITAHSGRPCDQSQISNRHQHQLRVNRSQGNIHAHNNNNNNNNGGGGCPSHSTNKANNVPGQTLLDPVGQQQQSATKSSKSSKMVRKSTKRSVHNVGGSSHLRYYLINLFVNDILIALFSTPFTYTDYLYGQWLFPAWLCPLSNFIASCAVTVSVYTLIAIGLERYIAVVFPFKVLTDFKRHTKWIIAFIWVLGISVSIPALVVNRATPFNFRDQQLLDCREIWAHELDSKIYTIVLFVTTFVIPLFALAFLYSSIAYVYFRHEMPGNADATRDQIQHKTKTKLYRMLILLVITFTICWLPIQLYNVIMWVCTSCQSIFAEALDWFVFVTLVCQWLSIAHTVIDPIIYFFNSRNFSIRQINYELMHFWPIRFIRTRLNRLCVRLGLARQRSRNDSLVSCRFAMSERRRSSFDATFYSEVPDNNATMNGRNSIPMQFLNDNNNLVGSTQQPTTGVTITNATTLNNNNNNNNNKINQDHHAEPKKTKTQPKKGNDNNTSNNNNRTKSPNLFRSRSTTSTATRVAGPWRKHSSEQANMVAVSSVGSSQGACSQLATTHLIKSQTISNMMNPADI